MLPYLCIILPVTYSMYDLVNIVEVANVRMVAFVQKASALHGV